MTTTTVQIQLTCPEWCTVTAEQHLADLWDLDGYCIHFGPVATVHDQVGYDEPLLGKHQFHDPAEVWFTSETHHDGRESAPPIVRVETPHEMSMQQALAVADALRDAVTLYESAGGRVDR